jgi:hypothetical protein
VLDCRSHAYHSKPCLQAVINTWHLTQYQRYNERVHKDLLRDLDAVMAAATSAARTAASAIAPPDPVPRPRILVCAPSNAATDELLHRVLSRRLIDVHGNKYTPHVVRVGSESAVMSVNAQEVCSEMVFWTFLQ